MKGAFTLDQVKKQWPDFEYGAVGLEKPLLDLMVAEGKWVASKGLIKDAKTTEAAFRVFMADGPMKAVAPERVTLP